jgi:hypothetical protein
VRTQGDDNLYPDPWTLHFLGHWAYEARFSLPLLGYVAVWVHSPLGRSAMLIGAGVLALILVVSVALDNRIKRRKRFVEAGGMTVGRFPELQQPPRGTQRPMHAPLSRAHDRPDKHRVAPESKSSGEV